MTQLAKRCMLTELKANVITWIGLEIQSGTH